jgi:hypothetical protein
LGQKNSGGGGGGATTCFDDDIGSPAKVAATWNAIAATAKAIIFFITIGLPWFIAGTR